MHPSKLLGRLPQITVSFDRVAEIYDRTRSLPNEVMARLIDTIAKELAGRKEILDLGIGTGRLAEPLQNAGFRVVGIDISRIMISKAQGKKLKDLVLADARSVPFGDKIFDSTISVHLLHLISEWRRTLREVCRVTRYSMLSLYYAQREPVRDAYYRLLERYGHQRRYLGKSEQDLRDLVTPTKSLLVCSYDILADDRLVNLQQETSSSQWKIPEHVNAEVVKQLKTEFAGKTFRQVLYLSVWETDSLKSQTEE